jgi:hypothetical protein
MGRAAIWVYIKSGGLFKIKSNKDEKDIQDIQDIFVY